MVVLYVISVEEAAGKTALCAGLGKYLQGDGKKVGFLKLIDEKSVADGDAAFIKQVLDLCGGKIQLKSKEGEGTRVTFTLPLIDVKNRSVSVKEERAKRKKIVIIGGAAAGPKVPRT